MNLGSSLQGSAPLKLSPCHPDNAGGDPRAEAHRSGTGGCGAVRDRAAVRAVLPGTAGVSPAFYLNGPGRSLTREPRLTPLSQRSLESPSL